MNRKKRSVTIYVRNKQRYNPASKLYDFINVRVENFAGTKIGDIKEEARRQSGNNVKIDDLYMNNERLADDRSVAHYNLEDGTILETTSNPFWATCLFIKHCEAEDEKRKNPDNPDVQNWTNKSLARKRTLLSVLFNSKNEFKTQPPHFPTLDDFVGYLNGLKKKGATMNPHYTQRHLGEMFTDYQELDVGRSSDPLGAFINRYAVKLGYRNIDGYDNVMAQPGMVERKGRGRGRGSGGTEDRAKHTRNVIAVHRGKEVSCDDCEGTLAELYCGECQNAQGGQGLYLCTPCSLLIHAGAARRRHNVQDVINAPKVSKPYVPHAFKAPFSILLGLYSGLTERRPVLSMTEDEIKLRAQPLTDTDLQDKQAGQYCGGFDCMEKILMAKGLVQREDSRNPTYALTESGQELAGQLYEFQQSVQRFLKLNNVPHIPQSINTVCGTRRVCLIIDEQERDKLRLQQLATERGVDVQFRQLGAGDYLWILSPPMDSPTLRYTQLQPTQEKVLPFLVERKSWEDFRESVRTKRFQKQVNHMLNSGIDQCFYLMEGSINSGRYKPSAEQQRNLKDLLEKIFLDNGFYINYTASWYKSAIWLLWATTLASEAQRRGQLTGKGMTYAEFMQRTRGQSRCATLTRTDFRPIDWRTWEAEEFIDGIFRDSAHEISLIDSFKKELAPSGRHVLNIHELEAYNKGRQTMLNKCINEACGNPNRIPDIVNNTLTAQLHNMLHYDVMSWWQLKIQFMLGVYIVRTEKAEDRHRLQGEVDWRSGGQADVSRAEGQDPLPRGQQNIKSKGYVLGHGPIDRYDVMLDEPPPQKPPDTITSSENEDLVFASDSQTENFMIQQALALSSREVAEEQNRALLSSEKQPFILQPSDTIRSSPSDSKRRTGRRAISGKKSSTATKSKEEEELELAIKLSLEDGTPSRSVDEVTDTEVEDTALDGDASAGTSFKVEDTLIPLEPTLDSQEELQYVLELSKRTENTRGESDSCISNTRASVQNFEPTKVTVTEPFGSEGNKHSVSTVNETKHLENYHDHNLKYAYALQKEKKSVIEKSTGSPAKKLKVDPPQERSVLELKDQSDKDLELALQLSLQSNQESVPLTEKGVDVPRSPSNVIEIKDSQDLLDDNLNLIRPYNMTSNDSKRSFEEESFSSDCIVLDDSQEEEIDGTVTSTVAGGIKKVVLDTQDCLGQAPETVDDQNLKGQKTSDVCIPETVFEMNTVSASICSSDSTLAQEPLNMDPSVEKDELPEVQINDENSNRNSEMDSMDAKNDEPDIIPPSPNSKQKSNPPTTELPQSPHVQTNSEDISVKSKAEASKEDSNLSQRSDDGADDEYCESLVLPPLSPCSPKTSVMHSSQLECDVLYENVKIKQEKFDPCESSIKNEEIVMDSQTLEDSQEDLIGCDWIRNSPFKTEQITVNVVTPVKKGENSSSSFVKGINLSQGSLSNININIHIEHVDKTSQPNSKNSEIDDEEYAKLLQKEFDDEYRESKQNTPSKMETRSIKKEDFSPLKCMRKENNFHELDAALAQSLHEEINSPEPIVDRKLLELQDEEIAKQLNEEINKTSSSHKTTVKPVIIDDDKIVQELRDLEEKSQRERMRQIQIDENLARQLLESDDNYTSTVSSATKRKGILIDDSPPKAKTPRQESWRKGLFSEDRNHRNNSLSQLTQIRREQNEKFHREKGGASSENKSSWLTNGSKDECCVSPSRSSSPWPNKSIGSHSSHSNFPSSSQYPSSTASQYPSSSLCPTSSHGPSSSMLGQEEDLKPAVGTQSEALSKSKCGNCGEIGHNRKWVNCPRYYSQEECLRREEQQAKAREKIEAREREEAQAKQDLEQHHRALKNIATQIEQEQKGLEQTIKRLDKKKKQRENRRQ
uniref:Crossover junction endonuclease MUS81 n=1 Tax=Crassostrea virginica TaxID=6565 RepID=A0A8B8EG58_CRAVI|nr:uncharacterized protein LOC111134145 isoform X2 [Crassostrea virginica]